MQGSLLGGDFNDTWELFRGQQQGCLEYLLADTYVHLSIFSV